jgi:hypothetical protein
MAVRSRKAIAKNGVVKAKKLSKAALKLLDDNAVQIAQALYNSTLKGHVLSTKLLVDLGEGDVDAEEAITMRPLRSLASELANEPQWKDETVEPVA